MSQIYGEDGNVIPVTVIKVEPNVVIRVKAKDKDGYEAVQIGTGAKKKLNKAQKGQYKELGNFSSVKEFRLVSKGQIARGKVEVVDPAQFPIGHKMDASVFVAGDLVKVTGMSKGKGFQGVVKRHGFHGGWGSHGHHSVLRHAGSIGQRFPQHTLKGMRMAGRMGNDKSTMRGLKVVKVDQENGFLAVKGAVPGNNGGLVMIQLQ